MAGHIGLELPNPAASPQLDLRDNFAGGRRKPGGGDPSRTSCGALRFNGLEFALLQQRDGEPAKFRVVLDDQHRSAFRLG